MWVLLCRNTLVKENYLATLLREDSAFAVTRELNTTMLKRHIPGSPILVPKISAAQSTLGARKLRRVAKINKQLNLLRKELAQVLRVKSKLYANLTAQ